MLRTSSVAPLSAADFDSALQLCQQDPVTNVFVAARLLDGGPVFASSLIGRKEGADELASMCWVAANVVPVGIMPSERDQYAARLRRHKRRSSSIFGDRDQVLGLWSKLSRHWGTPLAIREDQPLMAVSEEDWSPHGLWDERVRPARSDEVDLVLPAAAHMFTSEIGYPPYSGSDREYRRLVQRLIDAGQTYVIVEDGRVVFKADVGSLAMGVAQVQGVWVAPDHRGRGVAVPAMNAVVSQVMAAFAPTVSLYVNNFNTAAVRTYEHCGFEQVGTFATVIL